MPEMPETSQILEFARGHLALTLLAVGLVFALLVLALLPKPHSGSRIVEALFRSYLFWTVCLYFLYQATVLGAFGPEAIAEINAPPAPFDAGAAYGCLAFAVVAFLALWRSLGLRIAAVLGPAIYLLAPLAALPATQETLIAHAGEIGIALLGVFYLLLNANVGRTPVPVHRPGEPAGDPTGDPAPAE